MKRGKPLERRIPLQARTGLKPGQPKPRTPNSETIRRRKRRQKAANAYDAEFAAIRPRVRERSGGRCEARIQGVCKVVASHVHHVKLRSQGGTNTMDNLLDTCAWCHDWIHGHPASARKLGVLA